LRPKWNSIVFLPAVLAGAILYAQAVEQAQSSRYIEHVKYLASPDLQGRGAGTKGLERAAGYIAEQFREFKLQPAGENNSFWQTFKVTTGARTGPGNQLEVSGGKTLKIDTDYRPLSFSSNGQVQAPVVFAGYGITAPEFKYDDYSHLDVKNKIVLVRRYEPKSFRKDDSGKERPHTHHASLVSKAINARNHGAKAVLLFNGELEDRQADTLIRFGTISGPENVGILMLQVTNDVANDWIKGDGLKSENKTLSLKVDIIREQADVKNVLGFLPGRSKEYIVIGAHYDHLGLGNESSLAPSQIGKVHPGADDNASGTAGLLELARMFSARRDSLDRGVLFIAFAGEEIGLLGSSEWVNHPTRPIENAVAMLNMDMIGRVNGSKLYVGGTGTAATFEPLLKAVAAGYDFKIDFSKDGYSASDHTSFVAKSVPVLFFFSGLHGDYHKPSDTWDKVSGPASAKVVNFVHDVANKVAQTPTRPQFVKVEAGPHAGGIPGSGGGGGYGPYFGSIPDFAPVEKGVKFSDVRPGSPAAKAGFKGGDILISFAGKPVLNLHDFTFALRNAKVGDVVLVTVLRDGKEVTANVTLEARK
jgi:hypothetical protein